MRSSVGFPNWGCCVSSLTLGRGWQRRFPLLLSFATSDEHGLAMAGLKPVGVLAFFVFLDLVTANVIEPLLFGHSTGVCRSPARGGGLLDLGLGSGRARPVHPVDRLHGRAGSARSALKFLALLLGDEPPLEPHMVYLPATSGPRPHRGQGRGTCYAKQNGLEKTCDVRAAPGVAPGTERDRGHAGLNPKRGVHLRTTRDVLAALAPHPFRRRKLRPSTYESRPREGQAAGGEIPRRVKPELVPTVSLVVGYPAHHVAEELALWMLAAL